MIKDKDLKIKIQNLKLCYICPRDRFAWFTSIPLELQWGDDWDDAPYEHNAGDPYSEHKEDGKYVPHDLVKVAWDGPWSTPADLAGSNSSWSVQGINVGCVAWLVPDVWDRKPQVKPVPAGATLLQFIREIEAGGGNVYLPKSISFYYNELTKENYNLKDVLEYL